MSGVVEEQTPAICERRTNLAQLGMSDVDLSLATTPSGLTAVWSPIVGGELFGVDVAASSHTSGPLVRIRSGTFTATSAAYIDGQLVTAGVTGSRTLIQQVPQPLAAAPEIGNFDGMFVGKTTLAHSGGDRVIATSCSSGLTMSAFDTLWNGSEGTFYVSTNATQSIDMTPMGTKAFAVWSTASSCHYETITSKTTGTMRQTNSKPCLDARVASNGFDVAIAFDDGSNAGLVIDDPATVSVVNAVLEPGARSPRVVWDGARYWISYLDATNHVIVGYLDAQGSLYRGALSDAAPKDKAYELGMFDGAVWLFDVDPTTQQLNASRLCRPAS